MLEEFQSGNKPKVSIGLPVYNGGRYIGQALDSLLAQTFSDFELIISDNASTDDTRRVCDEYVSKDSRVRYYRNETNVGAIKNFNRVFELASGTYFMWASDHDLWDPSFISSCLEILERDPSVSLCYPEASWIDLNGKIVERIELRLDTRGLSRARRFHEALWHLDNRYPVYGLMRSSALRRTMLFSNTMGPDVILLNELSLLGAFAYLPEPLFRLRKLPDNGDLEEYLGKLKLDSKPWSALRLYRDLILEHLRVVDAHVHRSTEKGVLMLAVILCMIAKYYWMPAGILLSSMRKLGGN